MIRDVTETRRLKDLADLAAAAVAAEQAHRGQHLLDTVITSLFGVGLGLQTAMDLPPELTRQRIAEALILLDETIREIRDTAFSHDPVALPDPAPLHGRQQFRAPGPPVPRPVSSR